MADGRQFFVARFRLKINNNACCFLKIAVFVVILSPFLVDAVIKCEKYGQKDDPDPCCRAVPGITLGASPNKIAVRLEYNSTDFPNRPFELGLFFSKGNLDCDYLDCVPPPIRGWIDIANKSFVYSNLEVGNYCAVLDYKHSRKLCRYISKTSTVDDPNVVAINEKYDDALPAWVYVVLAISISTSLCFSIAIIWLRSHLIECQQKLFINKQDQMSLFEAIKSKPPVPVFLLYESDCEHHMNVIRKLAEFLEQNNCAVSCEYKDMHEIVYNKISWIQNKLSSKYKILLVNSKLAYMKQKKWLKNRTSLERNSFEDGVFLHALAIISHRVKQMFDYQKVFMMLPSYVSKDYLLRDICPGKHYEFPRYLAVLLGHLHDLDHRAVNLQEPLMAWDHCASAYDELLRLANAMTAYSDQGYLMAGCKQCNSRLIELSLLGDLKLAV